MNGKNNSVKNCDNGKNTGVWFWCLSANGPLLLYCVRYIQRGPIDLKFKSFMTDWTTLPTSHDEKRGLFEDKGPD